MEDSPEPMEAMKENLEVAINNSDGNQGRKLGGSSEQPTQSLKTPSKERCSLGAPSAYYFKYVNSTAKKRKNDTSILGDNHTGEISIPGIALDKSIAETSFISIGDSSSGSEASDLLNKSTLSDTTELTASNFVLAATSRQKLRRLSKQEPLSARKTAPTSHKNPANALEGSEGNRGTDSVLDRENASSQAKWNDSQETTETTKTLVAKRSPEQREPFRGLVNQGSQGSDPGDTQESSKAIENENTQTLSQATSSLSQETTETVVAKKSPDHRNSIRGASPSLRSRISASPSSLRKFTASLKKSRIQRQIQRDEDAKRRLSRGNDSGIFSINAEFEPVEPKSVNRQRLPPPMTQPSPYSEHFMQEFMNSPSVDRLSLDTSKASTTDSSIGQILDVMDDIFGGLQKQSSSKKGVAVKKIRDSVSTSKSPARKVADTLDTKDKLAVHAWDNSSEISPVVRNDKSSHLLMSSGKRNVPSDIEFCEQSENNEHSPDQFLQRHDKDTTSPMASPKSRTSGAFRLTPASKRTLTPSKLSSTPRRIVNPRSLDSPARNTRSAKKKQLNDFENTADISVNPGISLLHMSGPNDLNSPGSELSPSQPQPATLFNSPQVGESSITAEDKSNFDITGYSTGLDSPNESGVASRAPLQGNRQMSQTSMGSVEKTPPTSEKSVNETKDDTASICDIDDILGGSTTTESSASKSEKPPFSSPASEIGAAVASPNNTSTHTTSKELSQTSVGSVEKTLPNSEKSVNESKDDTASICDIDDILGGSTMPESSASKSEKPAFSSPASGIGVALASPNNTSAHTTSNELSQTSIGSVEKSLSTCEHTNNESKDDTASIGDIADILGMARPTEGSDEGDMDFNAPVSTGDGKNNESNPSKSFDSLQDDEISNPKSDVQRTEISTQSTKYESVEISGESSRSPQSVYKEMSQSSIGSVERPHPGAEFSRDESHDETASIGDLADILDMARPLHESTSKGEESSLSPQNTSTSSTSPLSSTKQTQSDDTASIGDIAGILDLGSLSQKSSYLADSQPLKSSEKEQSPMASDSDEIALPATQGSSLHDSLDTASVSDIADRSLNDSPSKKEKLSLSPQNTKKSATSPLSSAKQDGKESDDTASIGDLAGILNLGSLSQKSPYLSDSSPSKSSDGKRSPMESESGELEPPATQESSLHDSTDTASVNDIADILGMNISRSSTSFSNVSIDESLVQSPRESPTAHMDAANRFDKNKTAGISGFQGTAQPEVKVSQISTGAEGCDTLIERRGESTNTQAVRDAKSTELPIQKMTKLYRNNRMESPALAAQTMTGESTKEVTSFNDGSQPDWTNENSEDTASIGDIADILGSKTLLVGDSIQEQGTMLNESTENKGASENGCQNGEETSSSVRNILHLDKSISSVQSSHAELTSPARKDIQLDVGASVHNKDIVGSESQHSAGFASRSANASNKDPKSLLSDTVIRPILGVPNTPESLRKRPNKSPMRLTPSSRVKPTPTKIAPSPRRILNSPARNTRSAKRTKVAELFSPSNTEPVIGGKGSFGSSTQEDKSLDQAPKPMVNQNLPPSSQKFGQALDKENLSPKSPAPRKMKPVGILSSKKRSRYSAPYTANRSFSQRSVAFGSPEAAEYRIGSPSVSLTPMPPSKAKELFAVPRGKSLQDGESPSASEFPSASLEQTVEIEADINLLVDRISVQNMKESPALSPIANVDDPSTVPRKKQRSGIDMLQSPSASSVLTSDSVSCKDGATVELEIGMDRLLENAMVESKPIARNSSEAANGASIELSLDHSKSSGYKGGETVELEIGMERLLENAMVESEPIAGNSLGTTDGEFADQSLDHSKSSAYKDGTTVELEIGMDRLLENAMIESKPIARNSFGANDRERVDRSLDHSQSRGDVLTQHSAQSRDESTEEHTSQQQKSREYSPSESVEMTDAHSIASLHSRTENVPVELSIHAQKLDFSPTSTGGEASGIEDEGHTMELESDMTSLLAAVGVAESLKSTNTDTSKEREEEEVQRNQLPSIQGSPQDISMSEESLSSKSRSSRRSISSRQFTLSPSSTIDVFGGDGDETEKPHQDPPVPKIDSPIGTTNASEEEETNEQVDLTFSEVTSIAGLESDEASKPRTLDTNDALVQLKATTANLDSVTIERWGQLLQAVCAEVEKRTDIDGCAATSLSTGIENDPDIFLPLQRILRNDADSRVTQDLQEIAEKGKSAVLSEWKLWLATVLESFQNPFATISSVLNGEVLNVDSASNKFTEYQEALSFLSNKKLLCARRNSLKRRKSTISALEAEIESLRYAIDESKFKLDTAITTETNAGVRLSELADVQSSIDEYESLRPDVESTKTAYTSLLGLHSFVPTSVTESTMCFVSSGISDKSSHNLVYTTADADAILQTVSLVPGGSSKKAVSKYGKSIANYLDACIELRARNMQTSQIAGISHIPTHMQAYIWRVGRLDVTAHELQVMLKRYNAKLQASGTDFTLSVNFDGEEAKLQVDFDLSLEYPTLPLEVELHLLHGSADLDKLRILLKQNVKPGFGNLLRTCDLIRAYCGLKACVR